MNTLDEQMTEQLRAAVTEAVQTAISPLNVKIDRLTNMQAKMEQTLNAFIQELMAQLNDENKDSQFQERLAEFIVAMKGMTEEMKASRKVEQQLTEAIVKFGTVLDTQLETQSS